MLAIISDIHSNTEALTAVLADIAARGIEQIVCLGDVVGYGPEPCQCVDLVRQRAMFTLMGNHDYAVMFEPSQFNISAETASFWTRNCLEAEPDDAKRNAR
ncbi:MAG: metallophosphoesterase family protein, partial [Planctomycetota bacterium]|nr:metallophosphoesterase family protein [Planctomycetota bacterium]